MDLTQGSRFQFKFILKTIQFLDGGGGVRHMSRVVRKSDFAYAKTKTQISLAVTTKLISAPVFAMPIAQSLSHLNPKPQASSFLLWLYNPACVEPDQKPRRPALSERGTYETNVYGK